MTLITRTMPLVALTVALAIPATAAGQDVTRDRDAFRALQRELDQIGRALEREAEALAEVHRATGDSRVVARAAGDLIQGLALDAGIAAGRLAGDIAGEVVRELARDTRLFAQDGRGVRGDRGPEFTESFSRTFELGPDGLFELTNIAGDITITGGGGNQVVIEGVKRVRNPSEAQARAQLEAIVIEYDQGAGRLEVEIDYPNQRRFSGGVDFTIALPASTSVRLRTVSGDVTLNNVTGELQAESISGRVSATGARDIDLLKSVSGNVTITDAEVQDGAAATVSGTLAVSGLRGRALALGSVSGSIRVTNVEVERVEAETVNGNVTFEGPLTRNGRYEFATHSGTVRLVLVGDTGFDVNASTFAGEIRSDYPLDVRGRDRGFGQSLRGSFGDASAVLELRTFSGSISIEQP